MLADRRSTIQEIAEEVRSIFAYIYSMLTEHILLGKMEHQIHANNGPANSSHLIRSFLIKHDVPVVIYQTWYDGTSEYFQIKTASKRTVIWVDEGNFEECDHAPVQYSKGTALEMLETVWREDRCTSNGTNVIFLN